MDPFAVLDQLVSIITSGVADIKRTYAAAGVAGPSLDKPWTANAVEQETAVQTALVAAAASQLIRTLQPPGSTVVEIMTGLGSEVASLTTVAKLHIPELVREAGAKGVSVEDLGKATDQNPAKLARILRFLSSRHIFREVSPGVFAHNRVSSALDSGASYQSIIDNPISKYEKNANIAPFVEHGGDLLKGAGFLPECMLRPSWTLSDEEIDAPVCYALNIGAEKPMTFYEHYASPGREVSQAYFGAAMIAFGKAVSPRTVHVGGFAWHTLKPGSLVIDVGGGVGGATMALAREHAHLRFVVQDRGAVIQEGHKYWSHNFPEALADGRVKLQEHDFFEPQPAEDGPVAVYFLRHTIHNWSTPRCRDILRQLAANATPNTRVVIVDQVVPNVCRTSGVDAASHISGMSAFEPPLPLLASAGSERAFYMDMMMMIFLNAQERTVQDFVDMCHETGWEVEEIHRGMPGIHSQVVLALLK